jgi:hypothetical protein
MVSSPATAAVISCNNQAFNNGRGFARTYFVNPTQGTAVSLVDAMDAATTVATRTARGIDLIALVAAGVDVKAGEEAAGSSLLNFAAGCSNLGLTDPINWTGALGPQGALAVVGTGSANESGPVYAEDRFSGVAPPGGRTWSDWLRLPLGGPGTADDFSDARAVVFGAPFEVGPTLSPEDEVGSRGFDWNVLPPRPFPFGTAFNDDGFFGICVASSSTERIQNNHPDGTTIIPGILGSYEPGDPPLELTCDGFQDNGQPVLTVGLFRRVMNALSPQPAYAAALLGRKTGGTPGGFSRHFVVKPTKLQVSIGTIGNTTVGSNLNGTAGVTVTVATIPPGNPAPAGVPLQLAQVTIAIAGNSGLPANFTGNKVGLTNEFGVVVFTGLKSNSAGGYTLSATVTNGGLAGQAPVSGLSNQFHIKNKR